MKTMKICFVAILALLFSLTAGKNLYASTKTSVVPLSSRNWGDVIEKARSRTVSITHFYKSGDGISQQFSETFTKESNEKDGIFKFTAVDCDEHYDVCEKQGVQNFPTIRIYPLLPVPAMDFDGEPKMEKILNTAAGFVESNVIKITTANADTFIQENPAVPKVLLFTEKKGTPLVFRALSKSFQTKLFFGIVDSKEEESLVSKYKIQKSPTIIVVRATEKKPEVYKGEMKYRKIFEFLNVYSETFVPGGGSSQDTKATKSWLTEVAPEMTIHSAKDICLNVENVLCVILLSQGQPNKEHIDTLKSLAQLFDRKIERGSKYNFMWLDTSVETEFGQIFDAPSKPAVVVLNPGRRKRYVVHSGDISLDSIRETFDKIAGGDMKFTNIKGDLPQFKTR